MSEVNNDPDGGNRNVEIRKAFVIYTPNIVDDEDKIWYLIIGGKTFDNYRDMQRLMASGFDDDEFSGRVIRCADSVKAMHWDWNEVVRLLPEVQSLTAEAISSFRLKAESWIALSHLVAWGLGWELSNSNGELQQSPEENSYASILGKIARLDPSDLSISSATERRTTPLADMSVILEQSHSQPRNMVDRALQPAIRSWATILHANGVNLLKYAREHRPSGFYLPPGKLFCQPRIIDQSPRFFSIIGVTYGSLPEQWRLWWSPYDYEYAGEFWQMVEEPVESFDMPGSWKNEFDDHISLESNPEVRSDDGYELRVIWSEYRRLRPPA
ncbi:hypothetical protein KNSL1_009378 [Colletotrichum chrysophilum]|nr:hypothetical protein KNSL1_009378 [Colletotrichum chrysophilum]